MDRELSSYTIGALLIIAAALGILFWSATEALGQEGYHGKGHEQWHDTFYRGLKVPSGPNKGHSCCDLSDCRPTSMRIENGKYQVKVDGVWTDVPMETVLKILAPDGGPHVCAPSSVIRCIILPPEG